MLTFQVIPGANRAGLIGDAFNLARGSLLDYAVALNMTTYMNSEISYVPWKAFLDALEFIRGMLSKQSAYVLLEVSKTIAKLFFRSTHFDDDHFVRIFSSLP